MKHVYFCVLILILSASIGKAQSLFSQLTGVDIDLNRGTVTVKAPDLGVIPKIIQNAPKDISQALLNPGGSILATAIRFSRGQALNRGTRPIPEDIKRQLKPYIPANILQNTKWTTADGVSLDGALKNWFDLEGAVTLDDVVVFSDAQMANDVALWAHELTHAVQYSQMGVETFAFSYSYQFESMERQARDNASAIMKSIENTNAGESQSYSMAVTDSGNYQKLNWQMVNRTAKLAIPAESCIWVNNVYNTTGNSCPVNIRVTGVVMRNLFTGAFVTMPCNETTCLIPAGQSGPLISPPGFVITGVTAAYPF